MSSSLVFVGFQEAVVDVASCDVPEVSKSGLFQLWIMLLFPTGRCERRKTPELAFAVCQCCAPWQNQTPIGSFSPLLLINFACAEQAGFSRLTAMDWFPCLPLMCLLRGAGHTRETHQRPAIAYFHAAWGRALLCPLLLHYFSFKSNYVVIIQQMFLSLVSCGKPGAHLLHCCSRRQWMQTTGCQGWHWKLKGWAWLSEALGTLVSAEFTAPSPRLRAGAALLAALA